MPWCPRCGNEYMEGITECAACGCTLMESRKEPDHSEPENDPQKETADGTGGTGPEPGQEAETVRIDPVGFSHTAVYEDASRKAESFRSGAWMLILVGAAGLIFLAFSVAGLLPVRLAGFSSLVMGMLFAVFFFSGISSLKTSRQLEGKAKEESDLREELRGWCRTHLSAEQIDASIEELPESEEERYFKRTEQIRSMITRNFLNLDEGYLDSFVDEVYAEYFDASEQK